MGNVAGGEETQVPYELLRYDDCLIIRDECFCEGLYERESNHGLRSRFGSVRGTCEIRCAVRFGVDWRKGNDNFLPLPLGGETMKKL